MARPLRVQYGGGRVIEGERRESHSGGARDTHDERAAERLLSKAMKLLGLKEADLKDLPLGCPEKVALAWWLHRHTTVSLRWAADRLKMGHYTESHKQSRGCAASRANASRNFAGSWNERWKMDEKKSKCHNSRTDPFNRTSPTSLMIIGPRPLGTRAEVIARIHELFPSVDFSDPSWGLLDRPGFSIEFNMGPEEICDSFMLHVRGGGDAMTTVAELLQHLQVRGVDCQTGDFFSKKAAQSSFGEWRTYRDRVIDQRGETNEGDKPNV